MPDPHHAHPSSLPPGRRRAAWLLLATVLIVVVAGLVFRYSERLEVERMRGVASHELNVRAAAIDGVVTRHAAIPAAIQLHHGVLDLLRAPASQQTVLVQEVNLFLQQLNDHLGGPAIFVLDAQGRVVASSDWIFSDNLLGTDLSYMPFFRSAISGMPARHYGIDPVRPEPGYYFAQPIRDEKHGWRVMGVAVVKSSIRELERRWLQQDAPAVIVDNNGIVLLSSPPEWRYASLQPLSGEAFADIDPRHFSGQEVGQHSLNISIDGSDEGVVVRLPKDLRDDVRQFSGIGPYLALSRNLPETAWKIVVFADLRPVALLAATHAALAVAALGCMLLGALYWSQRRRLALSREQARVLMERSHQQLERMVQERTADLSHAITSLQHEVLERQRAERTLRAAQDELVQAAKLAVLGQMAAGITHELSQPLGAIRILSENAAEFMRRGDQATAERNLATVGQLAGQMGNIINPLKTFARKSPAVSSAVDLAHATDAALFLFEQRLQKLQVKVQRNLEPGVWLAYCDPNRLQQVLVNLIGNALDAMAQAPQRQLGLQAERQAQQIILRVSDTGCGLSEQARQHLFEPFFTTKQPGEGLGLGLTISRDILRDFGGDLQAEVSPNGGVCFVISLPSIPSEQDDPTHA